MITARLGITPIEPLSTFKTATRTAAPAPGVNMVLPQRVARTIVPTANVKQAAPAVAGPQATVAMPTGIFPQATTVVPTLRVPSGPMIAARSSATMTTSQQGLRNTYPGGYTMPTGPSIKATFPRDAAYMPPGFVSPNVPPIGPQMPLPTSQGDTSVYPPTTTPIDSGGAAGVYVDGGAGTAPAMAVAQPWYKQVWIWSAIGAMAAMGSALYWIGTRQAKAVP